MQADVTKVLRSYLILLLFITAPPQVTGLTMNVIRLQVRQSYAEVTATQKRLERQHQEAEGLADVCLMLLCTFVYTEPS